jgi:Lrp/AsnC family leucine-responsive transcriptional regulator
MNNWDNYDLAILEQLQLNARVSFAELGRRVHLTSPAVAERVKKLEDADVITGYAARINLRKLGYAFEVLVQISVESHAVLNAWTDAHAEVLSSHATTGNHCAMLRIALKSPEHLQGLLGELGAIGKTSTAMVLSSNYEDRVRKHGDRI